MFVFEIRFLSSYYCCGWTHVVWCVGGGGKRVKPVDGVLYKGVCHEFGIAMIGDGMTEGTTPLLNCADGALNYFDVFLFSVDVKSGW